MRTGFFLLDNRNPNGDHFYLTSRGPKLAVVVHITAGLEDLDTVDDHSAENTARYAATTDREVSWHGGSDTDSFLYLLPPRATAWHVVNYNTHTYGWEISKRHTDWNSMPAAWVDKTLRRAAAGLRPVLRELGIPARRASRAELDRAIAAGGPPVGLVSHAELQPADRKDPGLVGRVDTFPWDRFLRMLAEEEDTMSAADAYNGIAAVIKDMRDGKADDLAEGLRSVLFQYPMPKAPDIEVTEENSTTIHDETRWLTPNFESVLAAVSKLQNSVDALAQKVEARDA